MNKIARLVITFFCLLGFLYIRFRESELFYDPLIDYYHGDYQNRALPTLQEGKLFLNVLYRYVLNFILSIGLLWAAFTDTQILKFASLFYIFVCIILIILMYICIQGYDPKGYLPLFYVRRFLIQPLLIFLLLPAFFYASKVSK